MATTEIKIIEIYDFEQQICNVLHFDHRVYFSCTNSEPANNGLAHTRQTAEQRRFSENEIEYQHIKSNAYIYKMRRRDT